MASVLVQDIAMFTNAQLLGDGKMLIEKIVYDSRKTFVPDNTLFVAIKSTNDGHAYIDELYQKGIKAFMVEQSANIDYKKYPKASFIICQSSLSCLQELASVIRQQFKFPVLAIIGSNGKTVVKEWLSKILEYKYRVGRSPRSFNSQLGVPLSLWMMSSDLDYAIVEAGISKPNEMQKLEHCIMPNYGIITNIGQAHQENFNSLNEKLNEKLDLFKNADVIFYNSDIELIDAELKNRFEDKKLLCFGRGKHSDLQLISSEIKSGKVELSLQWKEQGFKLSSPYVDTVSIENLLLSVLCALVLKLQPDEIQKAIVNLQPIAMRLEQKEAVNNCLLIDDAYNSDLTSLELALDFLIQLGAKRGLSKTLILSDIYQSGMSDNDLYTKIRSLADEKGITKFIGIGKRLYEQMNGVNAYKSTEDFLANISINAFKDEAILLKGARSFSFERIAAFLEQRRHKTVLEIDLNALVDNLQYFRSLIKPETKVLAMVKAFSYGSGAFEIANILQHQKVDYLGVAFADEGIELRKSGITLPIIVMNPEISSFPQMLQYELEAEIYSFEVLNAFVKAAERQGLDRIPIHIKIDSGMNRLGFLPHEIDQLINRLKQTNAIYVSSVFSHLAGSDELLHDDFTKDQIAVFIKCCNQLSNKLGYTFIRHILNSAGIERFAEAQMDMVRLGIGMYGISGVEDNKSLKQVSSLKSYVSQIKYVAKGESIGYSRKGNANEEMTIAIVPIGYADGFNRRLSNGVGHVLINGNRAAVVGNICMDMCMVDISGLSVKPGDDVEIFGDTIRINDLAKLLDTIPYEIMTSISRRVKRVYIME